MVGALLETKLHIPRRRRGVVPRPRLMDALDRGAASALTLVSAPAGFGKTTLLTEWLGDRRGTGQPAAWLSLDDRDNDAAVFWAYVIAAFGRAAPGVGAQARSQLQSDRPMMEAGLATLLNDLDAVADDIVLVLDDFHVIEAREVLEGVAFLLDHLPAQIHLILGGRADPALPLARLRGRGELVEVRAADLRFRPGESSAYLNGVMGLALSARDAAALEKRTEGWIAALQLAALSMQGRDDLPAFIAGFAGDDRYIVDYLTEEVLQRQPEPVRDFLLQTSVLSRMNGSLCDAVTGGTSGRAMLEALDRGNLFLVPLDDRRVWYRYHHLFAAMLRARLQDEQAREVAALHVRASAWHEQHGDRSEAIHHALAAEQFDRAADLVEHEVPVMRSSRQEAMLRAWLEALPRDVVRARPVLTVGYVGVLMASGELERAEQPLRDAERWLEAITGGAAEAGEGAPVDEARRTLPGTIEMYRAAQAQARGDAGGTVEHARRAIALAPEDDHLCRAAASGFLGLAAWARGDLAAAQAAYAACMAGLRRAGHHADVLGSAIALADILRARGRLGEAMRTYEEALRLVPAHAGVALRGTADMHIGMAEVHLERSELQAAEQALQRSEELGEHAGLFQHRYRRSIATAQLRHAEGDPNAALAALEEAERVYDGSDFFPVARPIPALRARMLVARGDLSGALDWVRARGLAIDDDLAYLREFEHITLARVLVARSAERHAGVAALEGVVRLLERLLVAAEDGGRTGSVVEILVLEALAHDALGDRASGLAALQRAVTSAEPERYARPFVDAGPMLVPMLAAIAESGVDPGHVRRLLAALGGRDGADQPRQALVEPLTDRELEVLRLLASELDGPDIARHLVVSLNTLRTHTKHIYAKLGVNNRRAAVRRGQQLGLLSRGRGR